ncbi:MAG: YdeI/OmpD-associated family protein [Dermatophilaceae bacterium]
MSNNQDGMRCEPDPRDFQSVLEPFAWGGSTYVILRVPPGLYADAMELGTRRAAGTMNGQPVNVGLTRVSLLPDPYVYVGPGLRARIEADPGDVVDCVMAPVDPDHVDLPADVESALAVARALDRWESVRPAMRRRRLAVIESARRPSTRERRIAELVAEVLAS